MKKECKKIVSIILMASLLFTTKGFVLYAEENNHFEELVKNETREKKEGQEEQKEQEEQEEQQEPQEELQEKEQQEENQKEQKENIKSLELENKEETQIKKETLQEIEENTQKEESEKIEASLSEVKTKDKEEEKEDQEKTDNIIIERATKSTISEIVKEGFLRDVIQDESIFFAKGSIPIDYEAPHIEDEEKEDGIIANDFFGDNILPSSYDSRVNTNPSNLAMSIIPPIRNQEKTDFCWAYSTIAVMETSLRRKGLVLTEEEAKLSEDAVVYSTYYNRDITNSTEYIDKPGVEGRDYIDRERLHGDKKFTRLGGNILFVVPMSSSYMGFVKDSKIQVQREELENDIENDKSNGTNKVRSYMGDLVFNSNDYELENAEYYNKNDKDKIKKAIMRNGIVAVSYHARENIVELENFEHEIDGETYYYIADNLLLKSNHAINVVGWDDNVSKENFFCTDANGETVHPKNDGAWLCRNSWGDNYGNNGYFWLSYEESSLSGTMIAADIIEADTYKYNYHYDTTFAQSSWGRNKTPGCRHGNIYKISDDDEYQSIDAVSVGIDSANAKFDIEIWANENEMENPEDGTKIISQFVRKEAAGYYTIELEKKPVLKKGTYFSVVVVPHGCSGIDFKIMQDENQESYTYNEAAKKQSFTFFENINSWQDRNQRLEEKDGIKYGVNYRIKALTNPVTSVISFDGNDAMNYMPLQEVSIGVETKLNANTFEKAGYKFREWNEKADGTGTAYKDCAKITVSKDIVLYAIWDIASYTIKYDADGGIISNTEEKKEYGTPIILATPEKEGYTFEGWYSDKEKTKPYDGSTDISIKGDVSVFIYAKWKPIKYKIILNPNGQEGAIISNDYEYDAKVILENPGYISSTLIFAGWNEEADGLGKFYDEKEEVSKLKKNEGDEIELFAVWKSNIFKIKYNGNGSTSGSTPNQNVQIGTATKLKENTYKKEGYKFIGWNSKADGTGINYGIGGDGSAEVSFSLSVGENKELFATWEEISYTLVLNANGKEGVDFSHSYRWSEDIVLDNKGNFTGDGEYLVAWNTERDGSGTKYYINEKVSKLADIDGKTITLYAMWNSEVYFIRFDANGGEGTMPDQVVAVGSTNVPLFQNNFTKKGYIFSLWKGSDEVYYFEDHRIMEDMGDVGDIIVLSVSWVPKTYRIRYEFNGGTDSNGENGVDKVYGEEINKYFFSYPQKENYTFVGWYTDETFTNYYDGTEDIGDGELDEVPIYAKWQPETIIYWYVEDTTKLHLSSTVPTSVNYIEGQEIKELSSGTYANIPNAYEINEVIFDNKISPYSLNHFFEWYGALETITNIENLDTSKVEIMDNLFCGCTALKHLDLSNFNTTKVVSMKNLFQYCEKLEKIEASSLFVVNNGTKTAKMFNECMKLKGGNNTAYNENHIDGEYARIDTALTPGYFTKKESSTNLDYVLPYGWYDAATAGKEEKSITKITLLKNPDPKPTNIDAEWDISGSNGLKGYIKGTEVFIYAPHDKTIYAPENSDHLFSGRGDETLGEETKWNKLFSRCEEIKNLNYLDTSRVSNMYAMFKGVGMFNMYSVSTFNEYIPDDLDQLISNPKKMVIDVTSFDTSNVTNMGRMFELSAIEEIDVSNFDTKNVVNMQAMFAQAGLLQEIDISNWDMKKVTNGSAMFTLCLSLKTIDLTGLSFDAADNVTYMFSECPELETIYASNTFFINLSASTGDMFSSCSKLKGGNATTITGNPVDGTYARVDTAQTPGYFKDKNAAPIIPIEKELQSIEVANDTANKTKYKVGEKFNPEGLKIKLNYSDNTSNTVTYSTNNANEFTFEPSNALTKTNTSVKIKYAGKTANQNIQIIEISSIRKIASPSKLTYIVDDTFNPAGLKIEVKYTDDSVEEIAYNSNTKNDFKFNPNLTAKLTKANQGINIIFSSKTVKQSITVLNKTTFMFDLRGHGNNFTREVIENEKLNKPSDPTALGYDFEYWYEGDNATEEFDFDKLLTGNSARTRTLKAKWKAKTYTITYFIGENATISEISFDKTYGKTYEGKLAKPDKTGFTFEGWYIDKDTYKKAYTRNQDIYKNSKTQYYIYAKWKKIVNNSTNSSGKNNSSTSGGTVGINGGILSNPMLPRNQITQQGRQQINKSSYGTEVAMQRAALTNIVANKNGLQTYYTKENGEKLQGMQKINVSGRDVMYYFNEDATIYCGWMVDENNNYHYFGDGGKMLTNTQLQINNVTYYINEQGEVIQNNLNYLEKQQLLNCCNVKLQTGIATINPLTKTWSVTVTNPVTGQQEFAKGLTKLVQYDGINTYYFDNNGNMLTGFQFVNNVWLFFSFENGKLININKLQ